MDYLLVPSPDLYKQHVKQRITHFVTVLMQVWFVVTHAKAQPPGVGKLRRMASSVSPTAEAQAGVGIYHGSFPNTDAAHLMNTTVRSGNLQQGWTPSSTQTEMINALYTASAATTPQRKADNVGPDKVIDTCMTELAKSWAARCDKGEKLPTADSLVNEAVVACQKALQASSKQGNDNYQLAIAGLGLVDQRAIDDVSREIALWTVRFS